MFKRSNPTLNSRQSQRNLPGRSKAFSYYGSPRPENREEQVRRQSPSAKSSKKWWKYLPSIFAVLVILGCVIYELGLGSNPKIVILQAQGNGPDSASFLRPAAVYEQAAHQLLNGSITNRTKLTINTTGIAAHLEQQFAELANVSVTLPLLGHRPIIYLQPAIPAVVLQSQSSGTFVLNSAGQALRQINNSNLTQVVGLPVVADQSGLTITAGRVALPPPDITFLQLLTAQLKAVHITVQSLVLPAATGELDLHIAGLPYLVKFNLYDSGNSKQQIGTFLATEQYLTSKGITPSQYIDVRVSGRAYYK